MKLANYKIIITRYWSAGFGDKEILFSRMRRGKTLKCDRKRVIRVRLFRKKICYPVD